MELGLFRRSMAQSGSRAEHPKGVKCPHAKPMLQSREQRKSALPLNSQPEREKKLKLHLEKKKTISGIEATSEEIF